MESKWVNILKDIEYDIIWEFKRKLISPVSNTIIYVKNVQNTSNCKKIITVEYKNSIGKNVHNNIIFNSLWRKYKLTETCPHCGEPTHLIYRFPVEGMVRLDRYFIGCPYCRSTGLVAWCGSDAIYWLRLAGKFKNDMCNGMDTDELYEEIGSLSDYCGYDVEY